MWAHFRLHFHWTLWFFILFPHTEGIKEWLYSFISLFPNIFQVYSFWILLHHSSTLWNITLIRNLLGLTDFFLKNKCQLPKAVALIDIICCSFSTWCTLLAAGMGTRLGREVILLMFGTVGSRRAWGAGPGRTGVRVMGVPTEREEGLEIKLVFFFFQEFKERKLSRPLFFFLPWETKERD